MRPEGRRARSLVAGLVLVLIALVVALVLTRDSDDAADGEPGNGESVVLEDEGWRCTGPVDLDLVKVTIRTKRVDAINLGPDCTGEIRRIEVETWVRDGVKVSAHERAPHDITVGGGFIRCQARGGAGTHQDGIQVMGGRRIVFRELEISCSSEPNAQLFINAIRDVVPTDVVCERCTLGGGAASTVIIGRSQRSGVRDSRVCPGRFFDVRVNDDARSPIDDGNELLAQSDAVCTVTSRRTP